MSASPLEAMLLLIEDNLGDARLLREMLDEPGLRHLDVTHVEDMAAAEHHLGRHQVEIILLDLGLPDVQGVEAIQRAHAAAPGIPIVVLTGLDDESIADLALQNGAQDYLIKGQIEPRGFLRALRYAVERNRGDQQQRAMALEMAHSAQHDYLTNLPNRFLLRDRIQQAIGATARHGKKVGLLFLDLDGFKHINDSLGHAVGDHLLQAVAKRLVECVRSMDTVSRQGGDEFVVLLAEIEHAEDAAISAKRMLECVAQAYSIEEHDLHVTTSIGVSIYPGDGLDAETLIKNADTAMYQAKEGGRQTYRFFKPAMNVRAVERQSLEEYLRRALEREEFVLHYQPQVDLTTGEITGVEALIRWTHPTRGSVSPAEFIPVAEDCGLILPIGDWALREACRQAREWADAGMARVTMAVNISALQFRKGDFLETVFNVLEETRLDPSLLELELTESSLMKHAEETESILTSLRERGVRLAIDDFGTGYSSLSYLRRFPLDVLKIDQSFIRQITTSPGDTSLVTAVISMSRSLRLRVIAEGIETLEELTVLRALHCDEGQGYYFGRPVPAAQFASLLDKGIPEALLPWISQAEYPGRLSAA